MLDDDSEGKGTLDYDRSYYILGLVKYDDDELSRLLLLCLTTERLHTKRKLDYD